jgi:ribosomal protein L21E
VLNAAESGGAVLVSGVASGAFKAGDTVSLTVNGVVSTGQVEAGGIFRISVKGSDLAADTDHALAASITTADDAGNVATATATWAYAIDTVAPVPALVINAITGDNLLNAAEAGGVVQVTGTVSGEFTAGDTVSLTVNGVLSTGQVDGDGLFSISVKGSDLAADADHSLAASITATDAAGNAGAATVTKTYGVEVTPPVPTMTIWSITADNRVNAAEAGGTVLVNGMVSGAFKAGDTVALTINGIVSTGQVDAGGAFGIDVKGSDLAADADHSVSASITTLDTAGNAGTATTAKTYDVDTGAPVPALAINAITADNVVNAPEAAGAVQMSGTVSGDFKAGDTVALTVNGIVSTAQVDAGGAFSIWIQGSDLAADADHSVAATITTSDAAGNSGTASAAKAYGVDITPPMLGLTIGAITADNMVNAAEAAATVLVTGMVSGDFNAGDTVSLTVNAVVSTGQVEAGGAFSISVKGSDLAADVHRSLTASITTLDAAGNAATATAAKAYGVETVTPAPALTIWSITADNSVNAAEAGGTVLVNGMVSGEFKAGDTVALTVNGVVSTGQVAVGGAFSIAVKGSDLAADADRSVGGSITTVDAAGNAATATATKTYGVDTAPPAPVLVINAITADDTVNAAEAAAAVLVTGTVSGEFKAGDTVSLTVNGVVSTGQLNAVGAFSITVEGSDLAADADHAVSGSIATSDAAGNVGTATATKTYEIAPRLSINPSAAVLAEGDGPSTAFRFVLVLDKPSTSPQTVDWSVAGSGPLAADAPDFGGSLPHGTVTFAAGETTHDVTVLVSGDTTAETDEGFSIVLSNASSGLGIDRASISATIRNDDLTAASDVYLVLQGHSLAIGAADGLLANDTIASTPHAALETGTPHGILRVDPDGGLTYAPSAGFSGRDDFVYRATDDSGASDSATGSIFVVPVSVGQTTTLNLFSLGPEEQIVATYAAFLGRAADATGFAFWIAQFNAGLPGQGPAALFANIASSLAVSAEATALYPFLANPAGASDGQIGAFLDSVYDNLFNRTPDAMGLAYWTGRIKQTLQAGAFVGSVLIDIISGAQDSPAGKDITTLMAKAEVSLAYVHEQQEHHTVWAGASDVAAATRLIDTVTDDPQSLLVGIHNATALIAAHA